MSWRSGYHRISDDSVSAFGGHGTWQEAVREAVENLGSADIDQVWVREPGGAVVWRRSRAAATALREVVADVLADHQVTVLPGGGMAVCDGLASCHWSGQEWPVLWHFHQHQAEMVVNALTGAGLVALEAEKPQRDPVNPDQLKWRSAG